MNYRIFFTQKGLFRSSSNPVLQTGKLLCGDCVLQAGVVEGGVGARMVNGRLQAGSLPLAPPGKPQLMGLLPLLSHFSRVRLCVTP